MPNKFDVRAYTKTVFAGSVISRIDRFHQISDKNSIHRYNSYLYRRPIFNARSLYLYLKRARCISIVTERRSLSRYRRAIYHRCSRRAIYVQGFPSRRKSTAPNIAIVFQTDRVVTKLQTTSETPIDFSHVPAFVRGLNLASRY